MTNGVTFNFIHEGLETCPELRVTEDPALAPSTYMRWVTTIYDPLLASSGTRHELYLGAGMCKEVLT